MTPLATDSEFYQLLLLSEPSPAPAPDNIRRVSLRHVAAADLGRLLECLYIPAGPGGTEQRYYLIYEAPEVCAAAAAFALRLDVPPSPDESAAQSADPVVAFESAVVGIYRLNRSRGSDANACQELIDSLNRSALDSRLDEPLQWAAAMLAGHLASHWQADLDAAQRFFTVAGQRTTPGSPEELMACARLAESYAQAGDLPAARRANLDLLSRCAELSHAYAYKRAQAQALAQEEQLSSGAPQK